MLYLSVKRLIKEPSIDVELCQDFGCEDYEHFCPPFIEYENKMNKLTNINKLFINGVKLIFQLSLLWILIPFDNIQDKLVLDLLKFVAVNFVLLLFIVIYFFIYLC